MMSDTNRRLHELDPVDFQSNHVIALDALSVEMQLSCSRGFTDRTTREDGTSLVKLNSLADYVYWEWSPNYFEHLAAKEERLAPSQRQAKVRASGDALSRFLKLLNENHFEDRERILSALASCVFQEQREWFDIELDELERRLRHTIRDIADVSKIEIQGEGRGPANPGLSYLIKEIDFFWRTFSPQKSGVKAYFEDNEDPDHSDLRAKAPTIQIPLNHSSHFCSKIAKLIDPRTTENQVKTAMKRVELPEALKGLEIKAAAIGSAKTC